MLSELEIQLIKELYPGLNFIYKENKYLLVGKLEFRAFYDGGENRLILNPSANCTPKDNIICDSFEIEIEFPFDFPSSLPLVRELGGRVQKIAEKYNIKEKDIRDLHVNKNLNNAVCLCTKPAERLRYPNGVDIVNFLNFLVVPFFYGLSYYERHEQRWPWNVYSHEDLGIFEFYAEQRDLNNVNLINDCIKALSAKQSKELLKRKGNIKGHRNCICDSQLKFRDCHAKALEGLRLLKNDVKQLSIKI